jgi:hypothetical protein
MKYKHTRAIAHAPFPHVITKVAKKKHTREEHPMPPLASAITMSVVKKNTKGGTLPPFFLVP